MTKALTVTVVSPKAKDAVVVSFFSPGTTTATVVDKVGEHDVLCKRILDSYKKARADYANWTRISEQAYSDERTRIMKLGQ